MGKQKKKKGKKSPSDGHQTLVRNRQALRDFHIHDRYEAGMVLLGSEVKSLRGSHASIREAYVEVRNDEAYLINATIDEYPWANIANHSPKRARKLLLHRREIRTIDNQVSRKGYTAVALSIYVKEGRIKLELGLAQGKREHEKRDATKERDAQRDIDRALSERQR